MNVYESLTKNQRNNNYCVTMLLWGTFYNPKVDLATIITPNAVSFGHCVEIKKTGSPHPTRMWTVNLWATVT